MTFFKALKSPQNATIADMVTTAPIILDRPFSKAEFMILSSTYPELQIERGRDGKITIMAPVKGGSGKRESKVNFYLTLWWYHHKKGETFSASTGVELPDGSIRSPDAAWISAENLAKLSSKQLEQNYLQVVPDFVVEIRSKTDRLSKLKKKMKNAWIKNGVKLAWLIDPYQEKAYIYRINGEVEVIEGFEGKRLHGESIIPGMELPLDEMRIKSQN